jgi:hypothetical protein
MKISSEMSYNAMFPSAMTIWHSILSCDCPDSLRKHILDSSCRFSRSCMITFWACTAMHAGANTVHYNSSGITEFFSHSQQSLLRLSYVSAKNGTVYITGKSPFHEAVSAP